MLRLLLAYPLVNHLTVQQVENVHWLMLALLVSPLIAPSLPQVIYGDDGRREPYLSDVPQSIVRATALLSDHQDLQLVDGNYRLRTLAMGKRYNTCADETFALQPSVEGKCSGFLVAPDLLISAGHCFLDSGACRQMAIIFDYAFHDSNSDPTLVSPASVYRCDKIIKRAYRPFGDGVDYAVIRLDRATDRQPLAIRTTGKIKDNTSLMVIGHPLGMPAKISFGVQVVANDQDKYFVSNSDTYDVSSGSPVIDIASGLVEVIIVRGEEDFIVTDDGCQRSLVCPVADECYGEHVVRSTVFADLLVNQPYR